MNAITSSASFEKAGHDGGNMPMPLDANDFFPIVQAIVEQLSDELDHPDIWQALAKAAEHDITDLHQLIAALRPMQSDTNGRALDIVAALLHAFASDRDEGLNQLLSVATDRPHCPQVAGAIFFVQRHNQPGPSTDLSERFCEAPFVKFETLMDGNVAPCCSIWTQQRLGTLDGQTFEQIWNSRAAQDMRASILDGSYRYCHKQRCSLIIDNTLPRRDDVEDPALRAIIDEQITELRQGPRWLFLAHDVTCNLACPSCRNGIEAASEAQERRFEKIEHEVFQPLLNAEGKVKISVSGQGDPWSSPHYRSILRYMSDHALDVDLNLHTNALLMNEARWAQYPGLERYRALVDVSIDACTPWVYLAVRRPGRWERLLPNLKFIAAKRARSEFSEFHLNATIQLDNFHEMPGLIDLAETLGADSMRLYMMQNTGGHLARDFERKNIGAATHPLHLAFLETLRDDRLGRPIAHLYDVANWRTRAFEITLPSDNLPTDWRLADLQRELARVATRPELVVALCAAGRSRFRTDKELLLTEARALEALGFREQAQYRLEERAALGGEAIRFDGSKPPDRFLVQS